MNTRRCDERISSLDVQRFPAGILSRGSNVSLTTQHEIDGLARRIRQSYHARGMEWNDGCSTMRVWTAAAQLLAQVHGEDPAIPMDPELFVASQSLRPGLGDAWGDLTSAAAGEAYRKRVRGIVRQLERELNREITHAERLIMRGRPIHEVLGGDDVRLSALGRYIVAVRAGRPDLAVLLQEGAVLQHRSCPLYRSASLAFLAAEHYPAAESRLTTEPRTSSVVRAMIASLN
mgnify:CR=1 FL=1